MNAGPGTDESAADARVPNEDEVAREFPHGDGRPQTMTATTATMSESLEFRPHRPPSDGSSSVRRVADDTSPATRTRWASQVACVVAVVLPVVMAGCGGDTDNPAVPTTLAAPAGTAPAAGVPLEPGSNLPPVEGDDETISTSTG